MPFAVKVSEKILVDTVHECEAGAIMHWLVHYSGDYDAQDFSDCRYCISPIEEFRNYPEAITVQVFVGSLERLQ